MATKKQSKATEEDTPRFAGGDDSQEGAQRDFESDEGDGESFGTSSSTPDPVYDVISVVYHALKGAEACETYLSDVEDDEELEGYLSDVQAQYEDLAERGKAILATRLHSGIGASMQRSSGHEADASRQR